MDIKGAFINSFINDEVYVKHSYEFEDTQFSDHVYKFKKSLHGSK